MNKNLSKKGLVIGIIILFIGSCLVPGIGGKHGSSEVNEESPVTTLGVSNSATLSLHTFDKAVEKQKNDVVIPADAANEINVVLEELKQKIINEPMSDETNALKIRFVDLLDLYGLIPGGLSKDYVLSLLNPSWLNNKQKIPRVRPVFPILRNFVSRILHVFSNLQQFFKMRFGKTSSQDIIGDIVPTSPYSQTATATFCSMGSGGRGGILPLFLLPRPRGIAVWSATEGVTAAAELLSPVGVGFMAEGAQSGLALGFIGLGLTFAYPGEIIYGFFGYALFTSLSADNIVFFPPNQAPVISDENPVDGTLDVPLSLSELSFRISDPEGKLMSYTVTTEPDIGSDSGILKPNGVYSVPVSGLEYDTIHSWTVTVKDDEVTAVKQFSFTTEPAAPIVTDPLPEDDEIDVPLSLLELSFHLKDYQGDLMDYTVETVPDIGSGSGSGVGDGTYSIAVSGLDDLVEYVWFVNATDGEHQTKKVFSFKTEPLMVFDPFDMGWQFRKNITIDHTQVDGDLQNFPVMVSTVDVDLRDKAQSDGDDILFMDDVGDATRLYHEIEYYNDATGELIVWVNIPILSTSEDTIFYMYYGNSVCSNQQLPKRVWNSNYCGVWHLHEDPAGIIYDSTLNNNNGISHGLMNSDNLVDGKIGKCISFDGVDDYISVTDSTSLKPESVSLQGFFKPLENNQDPGKFLLKASYDTWGNADGGTYGFKWYYNNEISGRFERDSTSPQGEELGYYNATLESWIQLVLTFDEASSSGAFYVNGIKNDSGNNYHDSVLWYNSPWDFLMGGSRGHEGSSKKINHWFKCCLDEVRVTNVSLDSDWILTEYNNQNDPSSFYNIGPEESAP